VNIVFFFFFDLIPVVFFVPTVYNSYHYLFSDTSNCIDNVFRGRAVIFLVAFESPPNPPTD
jgi:hypothetical protein